MSFWDFFWLLIWIFLWTAYLVVLIQILMDVFRSDDLSGWGKAGWVILLVFIPAITGLIYLVVRGNGMTRRTAVRRGPVPEENYVRVAEAPSHGLPVTHYDRRSRGAEAYWKVAMELVERS